MKDLHQERPKWYPGSGQVLALSLALAALFPVPLAAAIGLTLLVYKWIVALTGADSPVASRSRLSEQGQSLVEYALVILLVSIVMIASLTAFTSGIASVFAEAASVFQEATPSGGPSCSS